MTDLVVSTGERIRRRAWNMREALKRFGRSKFTDNGRNNRIEVGKARVGRVCIVIDGDDNVVRVPSSCRLNNVSIVISGNGQTIDLGESVKISQSAEFLLMGEGGVVRIGDSTTIEGARFIAFGGTQIDVGRDCMFAYDIEVRTTDSHSLLDAASGERINPDKNVEIGEHVWLGARVAVMKGARIGKNSMIAMGSIVTHDVGDSVLAGGAPAKELRGGITWDRRRV